MPENNPQNNKTAVPPRQRIMEAASELFYRQGYRATGIKEIISAADVAKATFYSYFDSKQQLCQEYLDEKNHEELSAIRAAIADYDCPYDRFMAPARMMEGFSAVNDQRGCRFLNIAAEIPTSDSVLRKPGIDHYERLRCILRELARELRESDPMTYAELNIDATADAYLILIGGGLSMAELFDQLWPARHIVFAVEQLVRPIGQQAEHNLSLIQ